MFLLILISILSIPVKAADINKTLTVAVIDTGIDGSVGKLCKQGHKTFTGTLSDDNGHGTHVADTIVNNAGDLNYCLVSIKFYSEQNSGQQNLRNLIDSLRYAIDLKVNYINISGGGAVDNEEERTLIKKALDLGINIIVAAGNESSDLDKICDYYPACYDKRIIVVGNLRQDGKSRNYTSNYGNYINRWEIGTNIKARIPSGLFGVSRHAHMSGTSQATAVATGKLIKLKLTR